MERGPKFPEKKYICKDKLVQDMKRLFYGLTALLVLAGCDGLDYVSGGNNGNGNSGDFGGNGYLPPTAGSETVNGVAQPKGAIKRVFDVQTDNRDWHPFDYDDVYIYDAEGRIVTDKCNQKTYNEQTGVLIWDDHYEYTRYYDGTLYEWWDGPTRADKAHEGTLNAKGQLVSLKRMGGGKVLRTDTFTYDADGHLTKFVKDMTDGDKTTITYTWSQGNMVSSYMSVTSGGTTKSVEQCNYSYSREPNPTQGHFMDIQHRCLFPITNQVMMLGLGPKNLLTAVYIISNVPAAPAVKANLGKISRHYSYEWDSAHTQITKMVRNVLAFPCEEEEIVHNERTVDTFTFEYYK